MLRAGFALTLALVAAIASTELLAQTPAPANTAPPAPPATSAPAAAEGANPAAAPAAPPPPPPTPGFVQIGGFTKPNAGRISDVEKGDNGCYLIIVDAKNREFIEVGGFELCTQKPPLKGKKVEIEYRMESIMASSCSGNPKCTKKETVPYISNVTIVP